MKLLYTGIFAGADKAGNFGTYSILEQNPHQHGRSALWMIRGSITAGNRTLAFSVSDLTPPQVFEEMEKYRKVAECGSVGSDQDPIPF